MEDNVTEAKHALTRTDETRTAHNGSLPINMEVAVAQVHATLAVADAVNRLADLFEMESAGMFVTQRNT